MEVGLNIYKAEIRLDEKLIFNFLLFLQASYFLK